MSRSQGLDAITVHDEAETGFKDMPPYGTLFFFFFKIHLENAAAVCSLVSSHLLCVAATAICGGGVDSFNDGMHSAAEQRACRSLVELGHTGSDDESLRWYTGSVVR
jgi:hypothetical protein